MTRIETSGRNYHHIQWNTFMGVVNDQLVLVGRYNPSNFKRTNQLYVWDERSQQWPAPYPPMGTACSHPSVVTHGKWLVVDGGYDGKTALDTVEILDTITGQWYYATPLPKGCVGMKSAVIGDTLYLLGGWDGPAMKDVFAVSLPALIRKATSPSEAATTQPDTLWQTLPPTPLGDSAALALHGSLLAVGGEDDQDKPSSAIHLYQPSTRKWVKVGDMLTARSNCACTVLPSGEFLVLGGNASHRKTTITRVDKATVVEM